MRKYAIALLLCWCLIGLAIAQDGTVTQSSLGDSYFPELGNGGYDALHYHLDITPDMNAETLDAIVKITLRATQDLTEFNLDFWGFTITEVSINLVPAEFRREGIELIIMPDNPIAEGEMVTVTVAYNGTPREGLSRSNYFFVSSGWIFHDAGSFVVSEPRGASLWYPVNDHPRDKATYSFAITVPAPYVVATNGQLIEVIESDGMLTYQSRTNDLTASYLVTIHIGNFILDDTQLDNSVPIRNYYASQHYEAAYPLFAETAEMIAFYENIIGEYPFDVYGSVVSDFDLSFALETQTLSTYGLRILEDSVRTHVTLAHELLHQWFGNSVSPARWQDIWLNEGFASYLSLLWAEEKYGAGMMQTILDNWHSQITDPEFLATSPDAIGNPSLDNLFHLAVYWKGALALHDLRLNVGDEVFFEIIRTYYQQFRDSYATIEDFVALASEVSGTDLTAFFNSWLYQKAVPRLTE